MVKPKFHFLQQESKYYNESLRHYVTAQTMLHLCSQRGLSFITKKNSLLRCCLTVDRTGLILQQYIIGFIEEFINTTVVA